MRLRALGSLSPVLERMGVAGKSAASDTGDVAVVTVQSDLELSELVRRLVGSGAQLVEVAPLRGEVAEIAAALSGGGASGGGASGGGASGPATLRGAS